jgi:phage portal protein BeeE
VNWWPWRRRDRPVARQAWFDSVERRAASIDDYFTFNGVGYQGSPMELLPRGQERAAGGFDGIVAAGLKGNSIIWSCERLRVAVFTEARFQFQRTDDGRPGDLFGTPATRLDLLEHPWTNGTTGDLLARTLLHRDFNGNAYVCRRPVGLRVPRPDWVTIILGSEAGPGDPNDLDTELLGYCYWPGGVNSGNDPVPLLPDEVAHYAPMPDPVAHYRGMSWLNPILSEMQADTAATEHKLQFFRNGATMQTIVTVDKDLSEDAFTRFMRKFNAATQGIQNAYKTVYVAGGTDVQVTGATLRQLDFKVTQGAGETRIAAAAGTPPILVGLSEGLSAGQYNIYGQAKRAFVDGTLRPEWRNLCGSLETLVTPPQGSRLWYDDRDIAYLRDDQTDSAQILREKASSIEILVRAGYKPDAVIAAVEAQDIGLLEGQHTGLYSVQLLKPGEGTMTSPPRPTVRITETAADGVAVEQPGGDIGKAPASATGKANGKAPTKAGA